MTATALINPAPPANEKDNIFDAVVAAVSNRAFTTVLKTFNVIQQGSSFA